MFIIKLNRKKNKEFASSFIWESLKVSPDEISKQHSICFLFYLGYSGNKNMIWVW